MTDKEIAALIEARGCFQYTYNGYKVEMRLSGTRKELEEVGGSKIYVGRPFSFTYILWGPNYLRVILPRIRPYLVKYAKLADLILAHLPTANFGGRTAEYRSARKESLNRIAAEILYLRGQRTTLTATGTVNPVHTFRKFKLPSLWASLGEI